MSKRLQVPVSRLICFGGARTLTNAGPGFSELEKEPNDYYDPQ